MAKKKKTTKPLLDTGTWAKSKTIRLDMKVLLQKDKAAKRKTKMRSKPRPTGNGWGIEKPNGTLVRWWGSSKVQTFNTKASALRSVRYMETGGKIVALDIKKAV